MTQEEKDIRSILNKEVMYGMRLLTITGYRIDEDRGRIYLETANNPSAFDRPIGQMEPLLKQFQEVKPVKRVESEVVAIASATTDAESLKNILLDNIQKLQTDPSYIKQATAINNQINSYVNITKMQLDYAKVMQKIKK